VYSSISSAFQVITFQEISTSIINVYFFFLRLKYVCVYVLRIERGSVYFTYYGLTCLYYLI